MEFFLYILGFASLINVPNYIKKLEQLEKQRDHWEKSCLYYQRRKQWKQRKFPKQEYKQHQIDV